jgi:hypothetical protein
VSRRRRERTSDPLSKIRHHDPPLRGPPYVDRVASSRFGDERPDRREVVEAIAIAAVGIIAELAHALEVRLCESAHEG